MRSGECGMEGQGRSLLDTNRYIPHSPFRIPHWGGVLARTPRVGDAHCPLFHAGELPWGGGGLVRVSRVRTAGGALPGKAACARRRDALPRDSGRAVAVLPEREPNRAARRCELEDARRSPRRNRRLRPV